MAVAVFEFMSGPPAEHPHRVGKPLEGELAGRFGVRRGEYTQAPESHRRQSSDAQRGQAWVGPPPEPPFGRGVGHSVGVLAAARGWPWAVLPGVEFLALGSASGTGGATRERL